MIPTNPFTDFLFRIIAQYDKPSDIARTIEKLNEEDFPDEKHLAIFKIFRRIIGKNEPINFSVFYHEIQKIGNEEKAANAVASLAKLAGQYQFTPLIISAKQIREMTISRKLKNYAMLIQEYGDASEKLSDWRKKISELEQEKIEVNASFHLFQAMIEDNSHGISTGFKKLDDSTVGLKPGHFLVIGGYTNTGKTQFALQILEYLHRQPEEPKIAFISLEMEPRDLMMRFFNSKKERLRRKYSHEPIEKIEAFAQQEIEKNGFEVVKHPRTLSEIQAYVTDGSFDIVFVDFIQNVQTKESSLFERMEAVSAGFQNLAHDANCCIVALSQVNEEFKKSGKFGTTGFKGGGGIGSACDVGIILHRNFDEEKGQEIVPINVVIRKNRFGKTGDFQLSFDRSSGFIF